MTDIIKSYIAEKLPLRAYIAVTTDTVQEMNTIHDTTPSAAAACGRTLTATALMGQYAKG